MEPTILLTFLEPNDFERSELVTILREEGFRLLEVANREPPRRVRDPFAAVLVLSQFRSGEAERALVTLREYLAAGGGCPEHVIACGRDLIEKDENALIDFGARKVIQTAVWEARQIAERVLAALYGGFAASADGTGGRTFVEFEAGQKPYMECEVPHKLTTETRRMMGYTQIMRELRTKIERCGKSAAHVLVRGETGTGKELVAAAIHSNGANKDQLYIPINVSELAEDVVPSELFGHVQGAFTSAVRGRQGLLAEAGRGTVFLDEIGDLVLPHQAMLLRVVQSRQIKPVGASYKEREALDARLIFATNRVLERMCFEKQFRQDFFQRLREGNNLRVPRLSERRGDLELLAYECFERWKAERTANHLATFNLTQRDYDKIVDLCAAHEFGGNVRGLMGILRACFRENPSNRRFKIRYLEDELNIDQEQSEKSGGRGDGEAGAASRTASIEFDPAGEKYMEFLERARVEYFTKVHRTSGRKIKVTMRVTGVSKKTIYEYLPWGERERERNRKGSEGGPRGENDAAEGE
jgi:DNA-binding NtrC family response regulator